MEVAAWEGAARGFDLPAYTLPAFSAILGSLWEQRRVLLAAGGVTLAEAPAGCATGSLIGTALAVPLVVAPWTRCGLMPALLAVNSVPVAAHSRLVLLRRIVLSM